MRSPSADHDFLDRRLAAPARLAFAAIGAMLNLEKAGFAIGIHVIRDGRSARGNRRTKDFLQRGVQLAQLGFGKRIGAAARPDVRAEQRLIGIDISDSVQELLVQ